MLKPPLNPGDDRAADQPPFKWLVFAGFGVLMDQASKLWLLFEFELGTKGRIEVMPFFDLVLAWNTGISYSFFAGGGDLTRWILVGVMALLSSFVLWWLITAEARLPRLGLSLILAGALGNMIDRIMHGAVVDFALLHFGEFEWFVFNIADVFITFGAIVLIFDAFFAARKPSP